MITKLKHINCKTNGLNGISGIVFAVDKDLKFKPELVLNVYFFVIAMNYQLFFFLLSLTFPISSIADLTMQPIPSCPAELGRNEQKIDFSKFKGSVLLVDFWATWCPPCKQSIPFLNALHTELSDKGLKIIAINVDEDRRQALRFLETFPIQYQSVFDSTGACPEIFDVKAMPSSYFVGRDGVIRHVHLGYRSSDQQAIRQLLLDLLKED